MKKRSGFTLIELMIVIAIIIILAAIAIPNYLNMTRRAKMARVAADFNTVSTALEAYKLEWGFYPTNDTNFISVPLNKCVPLAKLVSFIPISPVIPNARVIPVISKPCVVRAYPVVFGKMNIGSFVEYELTGKGQDIGYHNISGNITVYGDKGPVNFIEEKAFEAFYNPFNPDSTDINVQYTYYSDGIIYKLTFSDGDGHIYEKTSSHSDIQLQATPSEGSAMLPCM